MSGLSVARASGRMGERTGGGANRRAGERSGRRAVLRAGGVAGWRARRWTVGRAEELEDRRANGWTDWRVSAGGRACGLVGGRADERACGPQNNAGGDVVKETGGWVGEGQQIGRWAIWRMDGTSVVASGLVDGRTNMSTCVEAGGWAGVRQRDFCCQCANLAWRHCQRGDTLTTGWSASLVTP